MPEYFRKSSVLRPSGVVAAVVTLLVAGVEAAEAQAEINRMAAISGAPTFRTYCSSCHGREALGNGPLAKDLKVQPANLTELSKRNDGEFPFEMVTKTIEHGRNVRGHGSQAMPAWGDAFEMTSESEAAAKKKIEEIAHYLWSIQKE